MEDEFDFSDIVDESTSTTGKAESSEFDFSDIVETTEKKNLVESPSQDGSQGLQASQQLPSSGVPSKPLQGLGGQSNVPSSISDPFGQIRSTQPRTNQPQVSVSDIQFEAKIDPELEVSETLDEEQIRDVMAKKDAEAKQSALGIEQGKFVQNITGSGDAVSPDQIPLVKEKLNNEFKPNYEEVALNYLDVTTSNKGNEIRDRDQTTLISTTFQSLGNFQ